MTQIGEMLSKASARRQRKAGWLAKVKEEVEASACAPNEAPKIARQRH